MANVLDFEKQQQILALGRLGWTLRRIEQETGVRRETASRYLKQAGIEVRPPGRWGHPAAKPTDGGIPDVDADSKAAIEVITDSDPPPLPAHNSSASACEPYRELIEPAVVRGRNAMAIWQDLVDDYGFSHSYQSVGRFVRKLRGERVPEAHPVIETAPGEEGQVDYGGDGPMVRDPKTRKYRRMRLFVFTLGCSRKSVRLLTFKSSSQTWAELHERTFRRLGGAPRVVVLDNLKEGVLKPDIYDPQLNPLYRDVLAHYGVTALPCRVRDPNRKAKVEVAVQVVERWILARLRNETFFSLAALNRRIAELLEELNAKPMRTYGASRRELFERFDKPALHPLPAERFQPGSWKRAKVNIDYHVELEKHYYSVPHPLVGEEVEIRLTASTVEILHGNRRVASHMRSRARGRHTTDPAHMPKAHQKHLQWTPSRLIHWGESVGGHTGKLVEAILADRLHPEQGYRSCLGILRLGKQYGNDRLEAACARALAVGARSYRHLNTMLKKGLDRMPLPTPNDPSPSPSPVHTNLRGGRYYTKPKQGERTYAE